MKPIVPMMIAALIALPTAPLAGPLAPAYKQTVKLTPKRATAALKRDLRLIARDGSSSADVYGECYPSSGEDAEDCSLFIALCEGVEGGVGHVNGGGYSCHVVE